MERDVYAVFTMCLTPAATQSSPNLAQNCEFQQNNFEG